MAQMLQRSLVIALLALAVAVSGPAVAVACPGADEVPTQATLQQAADAVLCLANEARVVRGRVALRSHPLLARPARNYARRMVRGRFFGHVAPDGVSLPRRLWRYRVDEADVGEVIAWGGPERVTPRSAITMWLGRREHRRILLARRWRHAGVGPALGTPFGVPGPSITWTMVFGQPTPGLDRRAAELPGG